MKAFAFHLINCRIGPAGLDKGTEAPIVMTFAQLGLERQRESYKI